jgi:serine/threonine-protein kinase
MTAARWEEVKALFHAAFERSDEERQAFVSSACGSDEELRREVESLLAERATQPTFESPIRHSDLAGQVVSHYRILERVGQGGMGVVYKAEDLRLDRIVALKFLAPEAHLSYEHRERFEREARSLAAVDHPNICPLYDIDEAQGQRFLVMAFVAGPTLKDRILEGSLDIDEAVRAVIGAADGLQAAHNAGVVHRDIKSANIMLTADGRALITDFGIALPETPAGVSDVAKAMGTPAYMSPEQMRGERVDRRSDIWSLGVVLYEAVSGRLPLKGGQTGMYEPLAKLRPDVPAALGRIVSRALANNPDERYQSAAEMAADLRVLPLGQSNQRWLSRRAVLVPAIVLLLTASLLVIIRSHWNPSQTSRVSLAVLPLDNLSGDPEQQYFTDGMTDAITTDLARIGEMRVVSRSTSMAYRNRPDALRAIARDLHVANVVEGSVLRARDRVRITVQLIDAERNRHIWAQSYEGDLRDILLLQSSVAQAIAQEVRVRLTPGEQAQLAKKARVNAKAYEAFLKGRHLTLKWQKDDILRGRQYFQQAIAEDPQFAPGYAGLADTYITEGFYWGARPLDLLPEAERYALHALRIDPDLAGPHRILALVEGIYRRNWPEARRRLDRGMELDHGEWSHYVYAAYYLLPTGHLDEALREIRIARDSAPVSPNIRTMTGWIHFFRREYGLAAAEFRATLELEPGFVYARQGLAVSLGQQRKLKEALAVSQYPETTAWLHALLGDASEARRILNAMIERSRREYIGGYEIAHTYAALGEIRPAIEHLERAYRECQPQLANVNVDPRFDLLRSDPHFTALVRKMNLER